MTTNDEIIKQAENEFHQGDGSWDDLKNSMGGVYNVSAEEAEELMRKVIKLSRLAALDDCKTLLERVLSETKQDEDEWDRSTFTYHDLKGRRIGLKKALAELEALRKKVEG